MSCFRFFPCGNPPTESEFASSACKYFAHSVSGANGIVRGELTLSTSDNWICRVWICSAGSTHSALCLNSCLSKTVGCPSYKTKQVREPGGAPCAGGLLCSVCGSLNVWQCLYDLASRPQIYRRHGGKAWLRSHLWCVHILYCHTEMPCAASQAGKSQLWLVIRQQDATYRHRRKQGILGQTFSTKKLFHDNLTVQRIAVCAIK